MRRGPRSSDPRARAPGILFPLFSLVIFHCLALLYLVISLVRLFPLLHYFSERVAATEPDLRRGTADRKRKK